jgi:MFS family permease
LSSAFGGILAAKLGRVKWLVSIGWVFVTLGTGLLCLLSPESNTSQLIGFQIVDGIGVGILFPALQLAVQAPQSEKEVGMAAAIFTFIRSFGQTFGVAMGGVIFQNEFDKNIIRQRLIPAQYMVSGRDAAGYVYLLGSVPHTVRIILQSVYADSLRVIWFVMIPFAGIGLVVSFFAKDLLLVRKHDVVQSFEEGSRKSVDKV